MNARRRLVGAIGVSAAVAVTGGVLLAGIARAADAASAPEASGGRTVVFAAFLDGKPIGTHRYSVEPHETGERLHSVASFDVKFLGITAYRYRHDDTETWTGAGCLASLDATTDDGGDKTVVRALPGDAGLVLETPKGRRTAGGCVVTFPSFYWHAGEAGDKAGPSARPATLLDPQDGLDAAVQIDDGTGTVEVHGATVQARHVHIGRQDGPIDLWYAEDGRWVGLDALVKGKHLTYRLK